MIRVILSGLRVGSCCGFRILGMRSKINEGPGPGWFPRTPDSSVCRAFLQFCGLDTFTMRGWTILRYIAVLGATKLRLVMLVLTCCAASCML